MQRRTLLAIALIGFENRRTLVRCTLAKRKIDILKLHAICLVDEKTIRRKAIRIEHIRLRISPCALITRPRERLIALALARNFNIDILKNNIVRAALVRSRNGRNRPSVGAAADI